MVEDVVKTKVQGRGIPIPGNDIDTDRIIPARYLKCVTFDGLGPKAFYDERYDDKGNAKKHPFNNGKYKGSSILIVNKNFGCGSSREHAPQSLMRFGIDAIVGESFAEIFAGNCLAMGIPAVTASFEEIQEIIQVVEQDPQTEILVDVKNKNVVYGQTKINIVINEASHKALIEGTWDSTALLHKNLAEVKKVSKTIPYVNNFQAIME